VIPAVFISQRPSEVICVHVVISHKLRTMHKLDINLEVQSPVSIVK